MNIAFGLKCNKKNLNLILMGARHTSSRKINCFQSFSVFARNSAQTRSMQAWVSPRPTSASLLNVTSTACCLLLTE